MYDNKFLPRGQRSLRRKRHFEKIKAHPWSRHAKIFIFLALSTLILVSRSRNHLASGGCISLEGLEVCHTLHECIIKASTTLFLISIDLQLPCKPCKLRTLSFVHISLRAIAEYLSVNLPYKLSPDDVNLTICCAQAIEVVISVLAKPEANILHSVILRFVILIFYPTRVGRSILMLWKLLQTKIPLPWLSSALEIPVGMSSLTNTYKSIFVIVWLTVMAPSPATSIADSSARISTP
ncbi:hypothetical protein NE237_032195 [Protea cynaroides]|uniref:Uncharacterized protein n=1 Tax=Protea cynaroides TaxID=273540 RepID=A0A9Q0R2V9_9MAGN|nr:hypothetical protein NE237_032195 [Protea cynaroides]